MLKISFRLPKASEDSVSVSSQHLEVSENGNVSAHI